MMMTDLTKIFPLVNKEWTVEALMDSLRLLPPGTKIQVLDNGKMIPLRRVFLSQTNTVVVHG